MYKTVIAGSLAALLLAAPNTQALAQDSGSVEFMRSVAGDQYVSTNVIGQPVKNMGGDSIGDVNALILDSNNEVVAVVIGVGGFLGIGEKEVAMDFEALRRERDEDGNIQLVTGATLEMLESAPEFERTAMSETIEKTQDQVNDAMQDAVEAAKEAGEAVGEAAEDAGDAAEDATR